MTPFDKSFNILESIDPRLLGIHFFILINILDEMTHIKGSTSKTQTDDEMADKNTYRFASSIELYTVAPIKI